MKRTTTKKSIINAIRTAEVPNILREVSVYLRAHGIKKTIKVDYWLMLARIEGDCNIYLTKPAKNILREKMMDFQNSVNFEKNMNEIGCTKNFVTALDILHQCNSEILAYKRGESTNYRKLPLNIVKHTDCPAPHLYCTSPIYGVKDYNKVSYYLDSAKKVAVAEKLISVCKKYHASIYNEVV